VGALAIKVGWDCVQEKRTRDRYLWFCLAAGILGVLVWVAAYASVYPTLSKGINDQIASLTVFDAPSTSGAVPRGISFAGAKWIDVITVAGQAVAEIFLSAVLGMYLTSLYARHRPVRLARDPASAQLDQERGKLEETIARERQGLGEANGTIARLENQLTALLAYGKSMFHREAARRQDQTQKRQIILEQLSDHVRHHLDPANPETPFAGAGATSPSYRGNGT
jgi:membrane protein implicated in regulation of membrane protease activity